MMFQWTVLAVTVLGSLAFRRVFSHRQRLWIMPFCLAYMFWLKATVGSIGGVLHFAATSFNFVIVMFLCNGFFRPDTRNNPVWKSFMVFWMYMFAIVFTGFFPLQGACGYLTEFVTTFAAGYFLAMWICRTEGSLKNVLIAVLCAALLAIAYSLQHGGLDASLLDEQGRAGLDVSLLDEGVDQNVNHVALSMTCFLPFLLVLMLKGYRGMFVKSARILAGFAFVVVTLIVIRTGSRNGALAFVPCVWYFFHATKRRGGKFAKLMIGVCVLISVMVGVAVVMRGSDHLRAFNFSISSGYGDTALERLSTGRTHIYENVWHAMSPMERVFGRGAALWDKFYDTETGEVIKVTKVNTGNLHSMYVVIFLRSGFVGSFLFLSFLMTVIRWGFRLGDRGKMALLFIGLWLATGVGEGWGMIGGTSAVLAGIGMGFLTRKQILNSEISGIPADACRSAPPPFNAFPDFAVVQRGMPVKTGGMAS